MDSRTNSQITHKFTKPVARFSYFLTNSEPQKGGQTPELISAFESAENALGVVFGEHTSQALRMAKTPNYLILRYKPGNKMGHTTAHSS
jgi:hypothetical protein